jgi:Antitoxin VbhA
LQFWQKSAKNLDILLLEGGVKMDPLTPTTALITPEEKAFREAQVAYGRGTVRLEGFTLGEEFEALNRRYIAGEITFEEHGEAVMRLHGQ